MSEDTLRVFNIRNPDEPLQQWHSTGLLLGIILGFLQKNKKH